MSAVVTQVYIRRSWLFQRLWEWRAIHSNGNIVAVSGGQGYENRVDCIHAARKYAPAGSAVVDETGAPIGIAGQP